MHKAIDVCVEAKINTREDAIICQYCLRDCKKQINIYIKKNYNYTSQMTASTTVHT